MLNDHLPVPDIGFLAIWLLILNWHWIGYRINEAREETEERALGADVIMGQLSSIITGSCVILAGVGAFVALAKTPIAEAAKYHVFYAACWAVGALALAVYTMGILPAHAPKTNFVRLRGIAVLCSASLFLCLLSGIRFLCAVWGILFS
ncbi:hypothetical protein [Mesorhizobium sp. WSM3862]|uniref:hypothetical protein n=1 Tax=Mesorhizobium sp. WSM3862 TaxID=632858 RepID=UPI000BAE8ABE|nr:hypothetical protein [Mesorhizobium sp. WSM3862]PBB96447.1 hypothetical protein CK224_19180 [Mesorhizobium sp. WSM3862]